MISIRSLSAVETKRLGRRIGRLLKAGDVVALHGDLGSGKTTLIKGIAAGLGVRGADKRVTSPSFVLINEYRGREKIYHADWYRLKAVKGHDRLTALECFELPAVSLVEWAERGRGLLPKERVDIYLKHAGGEKREIRIENTGLRHFERHFKHRLVRKRPSR